MKLWYLRFNICALKAATYAFYYKVAKAVHYHLRQISYLFWCWLGKIFSQDTKINKIFPAEEHIIYSIIHHYFFIANSASRILALSSHSVVRRPQASHPTLSPLYDHLDHTNQVFSESLWHALSIHPTPLTQSPNTNTQMHKYTNTASVKLAHNHICYIFSTALAVLFTLVDSGIYVYTM